MQITIDIPTNDGQKGTLLKLLAKENDMVLSQAYLYAKNLCDYGVDVAEKWSTVTLQAEALERAYRKGRYDEAERWANKDADKEQEDNGFFDEIMDDESDGEVYEKIKEIIAKVKEQEK